MTAIEDARAKATAALEWFDSIQGDRENGRVLIEYGVLESLLAATTPPTDDEREREVAKTLRPTPADRDGTARARAILDDECEALAYLITAFRFRERGIRGRIGVPDLAIARPLADFLTREGFRRQGPITDAQVEVAAKAFYDADPMHDLDEVSQALLPKPRSWESLTEKYRVHLRALVRAALEAAERAR